MSNSNPRMWSTRRGMAVVLLLGLCLASGIVACEGGSSESTFATQNSSPKADSDNVVGSAAAFAEIRDCDGGTSLYTVDVASTVTTGKGPSRQDAITNTIQNAIKDEVAKQFTCSECPDDLFQSPCDTTFGTIAMGGAKLEDPDKNCVEEDGTWYCLDKVIFDSTPSRVSGAQAGCDLCPRVKKVSRVSVQKN